MAEVNNLGPASFAFESVHKQSQCMLTALPGEIRNLIWTYALSEYEDMSKPYLDNSCYKRPEDLAPRLIDTALLCACKSIYQEAWFLPWANAEHVFYLTSPERKPPRTTSVQDMHQKLEAISETQSDPVIQHVRVYAQLYMLEPGRSLQKILDLRYFNPKVITITVRHTDWWYWEDDNALHLDATWVDRCKFPKSLSTLRVAFESLERKKDQINDVATQAIGSWHFVRSDGVMMSAKSCEPEIMRWTGNATWQGHRWLRDEAGPNRMDYYVSTVTWRPVESIENFDELVARPPNLDTFGYPRLSPECVSISTRDLINAGLELDAPKADALDYLRRVRHEGIEWISEDEDDWSEEDNSEVEADETAT